MKRFTHHHATRRPIRMSLSMLGLLLVLGAWSAPQATAQSSYASIEPLMPLTAPSSAPNTSIAFFAGRNELWRMNFTEQMAQSLASEYDDVRTQALQHIIVVAGRYGDEYDFSASVSELVRIYQFAKRDNERIMAVAALHTIGNAYGMQRLKELFPEQRSERVRKLTLGALVDYYGEGRAL